MTDYWRLVGETFSGSPGLGPGLDTEPLEAKVEALDTRMRTVGWMTWIAVAIGAIVAIAMVVLIVGADDSTEAKWLFLWVALFVWGMAVVATVKLWHFLQDNHTRQMKELLRTQQLVLGGDAAP